MDTSKFLKQIRTIIREEIEYALDKKMNENKKTKDERETLKHGMSLMKELGVTKNQVVQKQQRPSKSGLNSIQDILNETRISMQAAMDDDFPEMRFTSDSIVGNSNINMIPEGYSETEITPEVSKALTRDYSALMAKINEKNGR